MFSNMFVSLQQIKTVKVQSFNKRIKNVSDYKPIFLLIFTASCQIKIVNFYTSLVGEGLSVCRV